MFPGESEPTFPLVSIVIPSCDRREPLRRCLESLAAQTHPSYEVVVVDDASVDDTAVMLEHFAIENPEVSLKALHNPTNAGANASRNRGIEAASGELVAFLDSDCIAEPQWLDRLVAGFTGERVAAVTGLVKDPDPLNIYDLTFRGTHRVERRGPAHRLVGCNMCVRRKHLLQIRWDEDLPDRAQTPAGRPDTTFSGRCDEEGLFLRLKAGGFEVNAVPDAVILHDHRYDRRSFFRQALNGGRAAAELVYKYRLRHRLDMVPFICFYVTLLMALPLMLLISPWLGLIPALFLALAIAAITYNDLNRKGKTLGQTLQSFPMLLVYYHIRLVGYLFETLRLTLGLSPIERTDLQSMANERSPGGSRP